MATRPVKITDDAMRAVDEIQALIRKHTGAHATKQSIIETALLRYLGNLQVDMKQQNQ